MAGHTARVGTMAWSSHLLSSGSRDAAILQRDPRAPEDFQNRLVGHRSEVTAHPALSGRPDTSDLFLALEGTGAEHPLYLWAHMQMVFLLHSHSGESLVMRAQTTTEGTRISCD